MFKNKSNSITSLSTSANGEKSAIKCHIELIKIKGCYYGIFEISDLFFELYFNGELKPEKRYHGSALNCLSKQKTAYYIFYPHEIIEIIPRRFIHKHSALEIYYKSGKSCLINFFSEVNKKEVLNRFKQWTNIKIHPKNYYSGIEVYTNEWKKGEISNFEYLMLVNKFSSRCNHDISQYPVFPCILSNFTKEKLFYNDGSNYRKLNFPIGAQSEFMQNDSMKKYNLWQRSGMEPFHHGSHYSNGGIVTYYMLRIEPYTTQSKSIQGGSFDIADRLFNSMHGSWTSCTLLNGDVKELIPEIFYQLYSLESISCQNFGRTQDGREITHIIHPKWAVSNWDFLKIHKMSLESPIVSSELHNWIDLIFGYKNSEKNAKDAYNLFCPVTYEESFNKLCEKLLQTETEGMIDQVYHFGQTPVCIFPKKSHPKKEQFCNFNIFECLMNKFNEENYKFKKIYKKIDSIGKAYALFLCKKKIYIIKSIGNTVFLTGYNVNQNNRNIECKYTEYELENYYKYEEKDFTFTEYYQFSFESLPLSYTANTFALFQNEFLISGMHPSNVVSIHTLKGKHYGSLSFHTSLVSCVACTQEYIISASLDSTILSWKMLPKSQFSPFLQYFGHYSPISQLKVLDSYQIIVSASVEGIVLIHDIRYSACLRKINEHATCLSLSELGIIGISCKNAVKFYGLNTELIIESAIDPPDSIKFNYTGDYCIEMHKKLIRFSDPTNIKRNFTLGLDNVQDLIIHPFEEAIYMCRNKENNTNGIYVIKFLEKKKRDAIKNYSV